MPNCPLQKKRCGGCTRLSVPYERQLESKQRRVAQLFPGHPVLPILGMEAPYHYRNKVISAFAHDRTGLISGTYVFGTHYVLPMDECLLENEEADRIVVALRDILRGEKVLAYDEDRKTGAVRFAQVRFARRTNQALVTIVTAQASFPQGKRVARLLRERCPAVRSVVQNVNPRPGSAVLGFQESILLGDGLIEDRFLDFTVLLSSRAFYQVNTAQAEVLYREALALSRPRPDDRVLDVYCGIGLIGLAAAGSVRSVTGIEFNADAVRLARDIAQRNGAANISFERGDASLLMEKQRDISLVFLDPPRAGLDRRCLDALTRLSPERICYISCNPVTQARDIAPLLQNGYQIRAIRPVDMFPHTEHVESVALLERRILQ